MPDQYKLTIEVRSTFVHAKAEGPRTLENALRFMREAHAACAAAGLLDILLEMQLVGPGFEPSQIYSLISERAPAGVKLRRVAYVEGAPQAVRASLAETMAVNRGVNARSLPERRIRGGVADQSGLNQPTCSTTSCSVPEALVLVHVEAVDRADRGGQRRRREPKRIAS